MMNAIRQSPVLRAGVNLLLVTTCIALLFTLREVEREIDDRPFILHAVFDVTGHLVTALVIAISMRSLRFPIPVWSILAGGVVLDFGHVLTYFDVVDQLQGSSRNGSHSLIVVAILAVVGLVDRPHAHIWLGIAMGATSHLWRDMGTGTVALLWPFTETVYGTLFNRYLAVLAGIALAIVGSATLLSVHARSVSRDDSANDRPASLLGAADDRRST